MSTLGQRIRELRENKGLTQSELAKGICTAGMISQIESDRAKPSYGILIQLAEKLGVSLGVILDRINLKYQSKSKFTLAKALLQGGDYEIAVSLLEELSSVLTSDISEVDLMYHLSLGYLYLQDYQRAEAMFTKVAEWATIRGDIKLLLCVMLELGVIAERKGDRHVALYQTQRAAEEYKRIDAPDQILYGKTQYQLGSMLQSVGRHGEAVEHFQEALVAYEEMSDMQGRGEAYMRLALTHYELGNYLQSDEYSEQALTIFKMIGDQKLMQDVRLRLVVSQRRQNNWQESKEELTNLAEEFRAEGAQEKAGEVYSHIAVLCLENNQLDEAKVFVDQAKKLCSSNQIVMGNVHRVLGFVYFGKGDSGKGIRHIKMAISIFERLGMMGQLEEVTMHYCHYLIDQGQYKEAVETMERFHDIFMSQLSERGIVL